MSKTKTKPAKKSRQNNTTKKVTKSSKKAQNANINWQSIKLSTEENDEYSQTVSIDLIYPNPEQARKTFSEDSIKGLASSIEEEGLINKINVRPDGNGKFMIISGERRYRAIKMLGWTEVDVLVKNNLSDYSLEMQMIIENLQREEVPIMEEAESYKKAIDGFNITTEQLAKSLGKEQWRIEYRLQLLELKTDYRKLIKSGGLDKNQAYELSRVPQHYQDKFFQLILRGECQDYKKLRATAQHFIELDNQKEMFPVRKITETDMKKMHRIEKAIEKAASMVASCYKDNEVNILHYINPLKAKKTAENIKSISFHLKQIEKALIAQAAKQDVIESVS